MKAVAAALKRESSLKTLCSVTLTKAILSDAAVDCVYCTNSVPTYTDVTDEVNRALQGAQPPDNVVRIGYDVEIIGGTVGRAFAPC